MLGESRLLMDEAALRQDPAPIRSATVVASGHVVLLAMPTEIARECFRGDVLMQLRGLGQARQAITSMAAMEDSSAGHQGTLEEEDPAKVRYIHLHRSILFSDTPKLTSPTALLQLQQLARDRACVQQADNTQPVLPQ